MNVKESKSRRVEKSKSLKSEVNKLSCFFRRSLILAIGDCGPYGIDRWSAVPRMASMLEENGVSARVVGYVKLGEQRPAACYHHAGERRHTLKGT